MLTLGEKSMDVRCSNCQTEYEFDESRIPANGASVKCSNCYHVFRIEKQAPTVQSVRPAPAQTQNQEPAAQPWIVRGQDGSTITCNGLSDIQHMIKANRLTRDDYLQKPGQDWIALGDVPELVSIFNMFSVPEAAPTQAPFPISPQSAAPNQATQLFIKQADFSSPIKETETHPKTLDTPWPQIEPSPHQSQPEIPAAQPQVTRPEMATPQPPAPQFQAQPQAPLSQPEMPAAPAAGVPLEQLMNQQLSPTREEIPQAISSTNGSASLPQPPAPQFQAQPQAPLSQP